MISKVNFYDPESARFQRASPPIGRFPTTIVTMAHSLRHGKMPSAFPIFIWSNDVRGREQSITKMSRPNPPWGGARAGRDPGPDDDERREFSTIAALRFRMHDVGKSEREGPSRDREAGTAMRL